MGYEFQPHVVLAKQGVRGCRRSSRSAKSESEAPSPLYVFTTSSRSPEKDRHLVEARHGLSGFHEGSREASPEDGHRGTDASYQYATECACDDARRFLGWVEEGQHLPQ